MMIQILALLLLAGCSPPDEAAATALRELHAEAPGTKWNTVPEIADFDCDSELDHAFLGKRENKVQVAFVLSSRPLQLFEVEVGSGSQNSLCEEPAEIAIEPLDWDPSEEVDGVEGFRVSTTCKGLQLSGGECDSFHFYWNHDAREITFWRL